MSKRTTTVTIANSTSGSLRSTIPQEAARHLDLKEGDQVNWQKETRNGKRILVVTKDED